MVEEGVLLMGDTARFYTTEFDANVVRPPEYSTLRFNLHGKFPGFKMVVVQRGEDEVEMGAEQFMAALHRIINEEDEWQSVPRVCR